MLPPCSLCFLRFGTPSRSLGALMELQQYLQILRKRWWLIALIALAGLALAAYTISQRAPIYRSTATLLLSPALTRDAIAAQISNQSQTVALAETYARYLETRVFAADVIEAEGLPIGPEAFNEAIEARLIPGTLFFEISARSTQPGVGTAYRPVGHRLFCFGNLAAAAGAAAAAPAGNRCERGNRPAAGAPRHAAGVL